jgi:hypothetical protein
MRSRLLIASIALATITHAAGAQSPQPKLPPQLPSPFPDTVMVKSLSLANGALFASTGPISLNHILIGGKKPSHYRVSKFADFRDASWLTYPATVPNFSNGGSGACTSSNGAGSIRIVAHFQVRAPKVIGNEGNVTYLHSNIARDTTCMMISG